MGRLYGKLNEEEFIKNPSGREKETILLSELYYIITKYNSHFLKTILIYSYFFNLQHILQNSKFLRRRKRVKLKDIHKTKSRRIEKQLSKSLIDNNSNTLQPLAALSGYWNQVSHLPTHTHTHTLTYILSHTHTCTCTLSLNWKRDEIFATNWTNTIFIDNKIVRNQLAKQNKAKTKTKTQKNKNKEK